MLILQLEHYNLKFYLNSQDIFISGNAQMILPNLFKELKAEHKAKL